MSSPRILRGTQTDEMNTAEIDRVIRESTAKRDGVRVLLTGRVCALCEKTAMQFVRWPGTDNVVLCLECDAARCTLPAPENQ